MVIHPADGNDGYTPIVRSRLLGTVGFLAFLLTIAFTSGLGVRGEDVPPDFTDAPIYELGEIPFQTAWQGQEIKFRVRATSMGAGTPVSAGYVNPPSGTMYYDAGNFSYRPGPNDKAEFTVTFFAIAGANRLEQIVPIQPIPLLPSEGDLLGVERTGVPDPTSRDYLVIGDVRDSAEADFNHERRRLRTVTISGKEVVLRAGHANRLFESYHGNEDIREFHIHAERLIIASQFRVPSTKIVIRARHLEFQDMGGQISSVSTVPPMFPRTPAQSNPGGNGLPAGDIDVFVEDAVLGEGIVRFVLDGGRGQDGGPGRNGNPGRDAPLVPASRLVDATASQRASCTALVQYKNDGGLFDGPDWHLYLGATKVNGPDSGDFDKDTEAITYARARTSWIPTSGENAIPAGRPGSGGRGGRIRSNHPGILQSCRLSGGATGVANSYIGGRAGTPTTARFYQSQESALGRYKVARTLNEYRTTNGANAPAQTGSPGASGSGEMVSDGIPWFSSLALRQVLNHAKDAYLERELEFTRGIVSDYLDLLGELRASPGWGEVSADERRDLRLAEEEMGLLAHRIASGLDYFGNPPGWVPLLSLEANKLAFSEEIDRAMGILYLEYWLGDAGRSLQSKLAALGDARIKLAADSEALAREFDAANNLLPQLDGMVLAIDQETTRLQGELKALEGLLLQRAEANVKGPGWSRVAKGLAAVCKLVPVPWVQAVGAGLDVVARFNPKQPWESLEGIKDVVSTYRSGGFDTVSRDLNNAYKKIKFPDLPKNIDPNRIKDFVDDIQKSSQPIVGKLKEVQQAFEGGQAPRSQIDAELAKLKAESREFRQLGDRISVLMGEKESFVQQVSQTMQVLGNLSEGITGNLLAMDAFNEDYAQAAGALDDRALMYLKEIGRRARERLLLYHYYVKKAYEYRLLRPYPGRLDLQRLFERFRALAEGSGGAYRQLTAEEFRGLRGIYDDALGELIKEVVVEYNRNAPALSAPRRLALTQDELALLNQGQEITLDLRTINGTGLFPRSEENLRIAAVRVHQLAIEPPVSSRVGDEVSLFIEHSGASSMHTTANNRARSYRFVHYTRDSEVPVQWGARYFPVGGQLVPIARSLSADSLLGALLDRSGTDPRNAGYFTYLGGLTELRLKREQTAAPGTVLRLREVVLEIEYEFVRRSSAMRSLEVVTSDGLAPYFEISSPDLGERQDGLGQFERIYRSGTEVTVSAPDRVGNLRFAGFVDLGQGNALVPGHEPGPVTIQRSARPASNPVLSRFDGTQHHLTMNLASDRRIEARYISMESLQLGIAHDVAAREVRLLLDGERYSPFRLEVSSELRGPWIPILDGTLITPVERTLPSPSGDTQFYRLIPR